MNTQDTSASSPIQIRPLRLRVDTQTEDVRIELVPMIDVIFCILTFFILAAVGFSRQQAINVDIPKAQTGTPQGKEILMITLDQKGKIYVEQDPILSEEQFKGKLEAYRQQNPTGLMALYASEDALYNKVVQVLDLLREVGGERVALATLAGKPLPINQEATPQAPTTSVPGFNPNQPPATSAPGTIPATPGINPDLGGIPTNPNQQPSGIPNLNNPGAGTLPQQGIPNLNNPGAGTLPQQGIPNLNSPGTLPPSSPGGRGVNPNPSPTASPKKKDFAPES
ncbi:MAG: biopolymer transporter ExbD [Symploca sp. SIO2E6]|nr:biopolymer transporter ExbD [Symploca sp. SIO2E6]